MFRSYRSVKWTHFFDPFPNFSEHFSERKNVVCSLRVKEPFTQHTILTFLTLIRLFIAVSHKTNLFPSMNAKSQAVASLQQYRTHVLILRTRPISVNLPACSPPDSFMLYMISFVGHRSSVTFDFSFVVFLSGEWRIVKIYKHSFQQAVPTLHGISLKFAIIL